ncbi:hypothetical protein PPACK8108_LOCUS21769 [Phakopsora pachyrhizi]|uniref:Uncharacterized protein n=1 Tax=Phakopsora pachyrhizi TaxID=170000 RepID=A0AAV0BM48_PHAPC|nr:hypothetical protein PPACK8108_LOCUS21769 [Phakopsora pachyrhizi]
MERQRGTVETEQPKKKSIHKMAEGGSKVRTRMNFQINKLNSRPGFEANTRGGNVLWDVLVVQDLGYECDSRKWPTEKCTQRLALKTISTSMEKWKLSTSLELQEWVAQNREATTATECQRPSTEMTQSSQTWDMKRAYVEMKDKERQPVSRVKARTELERSNVQTSKQEERTEQTKKKKQIRKN